MEIFHKFLNAIFFKSFPEVEHLSSICSVSQTTQEHGVLGSKLGYHPRSQEVGDSEGCVEQRVGDVAITLKIFNVTCCVGLLGTVENSLLNRYWCSEEETLLTQGFKKKNKRIFETPSRKKSIFF